MSRNSEHHVILQSFPVDSRVRLNLKELIVSGHMRVPGETLVCLKGANGHPYGCFASDLVEKITDGPTQTGETDAQTRG